MSLPPLYEKPVALDSKIHLNLRIRPSDSGLRFSSKVNSVVLSCVEYPQACRHLPIVFAKSADQQVISMALLGYRNHENLFVDAAGRWIGSYVPAYIRRYPFVVAKTAESQRYTVCIDEAYPGFGGDEGQPLFNAKGEPTDFLKGALGFLQDFQVQLERTEAFLRMLVELDLLMDISANVSQADGQRYSLGGMMMVDERKLKALPEARIAQLLQSGDLAWIFSHLISLSNLRQMPNPTSAAGAPPAEQIPAAAKPARKK